jgi:hypothetical protein
MSTEADNLKKAVSELRAIIYLEITPVVMPAIVWLKKFIRALRIVRDHWRQCLQEQRDFETISRFIESCKKNAKGSKTTEEK